MRLPNLIPLLSASILLFGCGSSTPVPLVEPLPPPPDGFERMTVVVAVVDSLMPIDIAAETMPTLTSLIEAGTQYTQSRAVFAAETIPNHVAMMTGVYPNRNGIPTNNFWDKDALPNAPEGQDLDLPKELSAKTLFTWIREECPDMVSSALMSKDYLFEIFCGDDPKPEGEDICSDRGLGSNDNPNLVNVRPDLYWNPQEDPTFIPSPGGLTPDMTTMSQALQRLPGADFMFINLGNVDRSAHAAGTEGRQAALAAVDVELNNLRTQLQNNGRWDNTVLIIVSDHGMDYSPVGLDSVTLQGTLDTMSNDCGFEPMLAVQGGGTDHVFITNLDATLAERQATLRAARTCLLDSDSAACTQIISDNCPLGTSLAPQINGLPPAGSAISEAWYRVDDATDPDGNMPDNVESDHENIGDIIFLAADGYKFAEPNASGNPIPGNHGHLVTIHNTMIVSGGASFLNTLNTIEPPAGETPFTLLDRISNQSENIDVAPTVAWLLGLDIDPTEFPDHDSGETGGFDRRILSEAFTQFNNDANPPSPFSCGLISVTN